MKLELLKVEFALYAVELLVEAYAFALLRHIFGRKQQLHVAFDHAGSATNSCPSLESSGVRVSENSSFFKFKHGLLQYALVGFVTEVGNESRLFGSEKVSGTPYVEVLHGDVDAAAKFAETLDCLQPSTRNAGLSGMWGGTRR